MSLFRSTNRSTSSSYARWLASISVVMLGIWTARGAVGMEPFPAPFASSYPPRTSADVVNLDRLMTAEAAAQPGMGLAPPIAGGVQPVIGSAPPGVGGVQPASHTFAGYGSPPAIDYEIAASDWGFHLLPESILYKAYLAGMKESRLAGHVFSGSSGINGGDLLFEGTLGGRFGIFRIGNGSHLNPQGFQVDVEGSAQVRLNPSEEVDVQATDYRIGVPLTFASGPLQFKTGYYHLSSHAGDEFLLKNQDFDRLNYARDVLLLGIGYNVTPDLRVYGEVGWAFFSDVANEWEFQFGVDYAPALPTGLRGAPFAAFNAHLREELNYGGNVAFQAGWAWRTEFGRLLRMGLHVYTGESNQYSFFDFYEEQVGAAIWYDY